MFHLYFRGFHLRLLYHSISSSTPVTLTIPPVLSLSSATSILSYLIHLFKHQNPSLQASKPLPLASFS